MNPIPMNEVLVFGPSRSGFQHAVVKNAEEPKSVATFSSSDLGAASHEMRHMIDADFLRSLGNGLFESIVPAVPTVSVV